MLEDGIGEFLNMVAGNAVTGLEQEGILVRLTHLSVASPHLTLMCSK